VREEGIQLKAGSLNDYPETHVTTTNNGICVFGMVCFVQKWIYS